MHPKYFKYIHTFFVVIPMTFLMSGLASFLDGKFTDDGWGLEFLKTWLLTMPVAYASVLFILPIAKKMTENLIDKKLENDISEE